jgi:hypothetical protein
MRLTAYFPLRCVGGTNKSSGPTERSVIEETGLLIVASTSLALVSFSWDNDSFIDLPLRSCLEARFCLKVLYEYCWFKLGKSIRYNE